MTPQAHIPGLDRHGHLSELALDHYLYGSAEARAALAPHLSACAACRATLEAMQAADAAAPVPLPPVRARAHRRPRRGLRWGLGLGALAAAALALMVIAPWRGPPRDEAAGISARGSALAFTVYLHDGRSARVAAHGSAVRPGERARFEVALARDGYLLIAGIDDRGEVYPGFPQDTGHAPAAAVFVTRSLTPLALPTAVAFDSAPGVEHLFAMLCEAPFDAATMAEAMRASLRSGEAVTTPAGCALRRVDLAKRAR